MSMDKGSELILAEILKKSPETIDQFDLDFLVARRGYLSDAQREAYGVDEEVARKEREAAKKIEKEKKTADVPAEITTYTMPQLLKAAAEQGAQVPEDATREEVIALLQGKPAEESADAPAAPEKPKAKTAAKKTASKPKAKK